MAADRWLLSQLRARAEPAVEALYEDYYARIYRYLAQLVGDDAVAAELAQDTFVKIYIALPRLSDESNLHAWVFQIATRVAYSYQRHRRLIRWLPLDAFVGLDRSYEQEVEQRDAVRAALHELPVDQRSGLLLHAWAGLSCAEIGRVLGKSQNAVRMMLVRARRRFRVAYDSLGGPGCPGDAR